MGKITNKQILIGVMLVGIIASEQLLLKLLFFAMEIAVAIFADDE